MWCRRTGTTPHAGQTVAVRTGASNDTVTTLVADWQGTTHHQITNSTGATWRAIANIFRSSSYARTELTEATALYRVYGDKAKQLGSCWTRTRPTGPLQSQLDSALNPEWGNSATKVARIQVPAGTTICEGVAVAQPIAGGGSLPAGGSQVYIPRVDPSWLD